MTKIETVKAKIDQLKKFDTDRIEFGEVTNALDEEHAGTEIDGTINEMRREFNAFMRKLNASRKAYIEKQSTLQTGRLVNSMTDSLGGDGHAAQQSINDFADAMKYDPEATQAFLKQMKERKAQETGAAQGTSDALKSASEAGKETGKETGETPDKPIAPEKPTDAQNADNKSDVNDNLDDLAGALDNANLNDLLGDDANN